MCLEINGCAKQCRPWSDATFCDIWLIWNEYRVYTICSGLFVQILILTWQLGPEVIKLFSCSTPLSMKFVLLIKFKLLTIANSFWLKCCWHFHIYYMLQYLLDFQSSAENQSMTFWCHHRGHCTEKLLEANIKWSYIVVLSIVQFWLLTYDSWVISHAIGFDLVSEDNVSQ